MSKAEILNIRVQVLNAFDRARADNTPFSLLIRREWERCGYVRVPAS